MHHTETTLKSTFQRSGTPAERFHSRERERRRRKREEVRALSNRDRSRGRGSDDGARDANGTTENRLVLRRRSSDSEGDDDGRTRSSAVSRGTRSSRARSASGPREPRGGERPQRMQGDLTQRRRLGCLGSSTDRTFRPEGSGMLGPPKVVCATADEEPRVNDRSRSRGRVTQQRSPLPASSDSRVKAGRSESRGAQSRGKSATRKSIAESRGRDPSQSRATSRSRPRTASSVARTTKSSRNQSRGPSAAESRSRRSADDQDPKRSQSRGRLDDRLSRSGARSQSCGRRDEETFAPSSKSKSSRSQSRNRRGEDQTVATNRTSKSKSSRSQSRDRRGEECTVKSKSSRSQSRDRRSGEECTVKSSKSRDHRKSSSATVASSSSGWRGIKQSILDHNGFSNLTHYSGSSGKYSGGTEETSPMSHYSGKEPQEQEREKKRDKKKKNKAFTPAMPPAISPNLVAGLAAGDIHKSTTYSPDAETIVTNLYDRTGHCVRHPHVRLRKKKLWGGGWNILIANCPDCCLEEMGRIVRLSKEKENPASKGKAEEKESKKKTVRGVTGVKDRRSSESVYPTCSQEYHDAKSVRSSKSNRRDESNRSRSLDKNCENNDSVPIFEFDIPLEDQPGHHSPTFTSARSVKSRKSLKSSVSKKSVKSSKTTKTSKSCKTSKSAQTSGSERTEKSGKTMKTTKTAKSSSKSVKTTKSSKSIQSTNTRRQPSEHSDNNDSPRANTTGTTSAVRVAKMPYTDHFGCHGKFSGEVNSFGQPNGKGVLRYDDGRVSEGIWVDGRCEHDDRDCGRSVSNRSVTNKSVSNRSVSNKSVSNRSVSNRSLSRSPGRNSQPHQRPPQHKGYITNMPWSDVNGFGGHYTGEINASNAPEGRGYMQYSNGVIEDGLWCNGVFQPPVNAPQPPPYHNQDVPSSSMSVWSLRSAPNMANYNYDIGGHGGGGRAGSVYGMRY
ncbi:hypothetical protein ACHAWX_006190 [Stephanocyclus meneghinianus]